MSATDDNTLYFDVQQKTDKQHILDNPDTYIGSVETVDSNMWIMNEASDKIIEKNISYIPGLFKLFDEGIVNCRDHVVRMQSKIEQNVDNSLPVTYIDVAIQEDGTIVMVNDGNGIDVAEHPESSSGERKSGDDTGEGNRSTEEVEPRRRIRRPGSMKSLSRPAPRW